MNRILLKSIGIPALLCGLTSCAIPDLEGARGPISYSVPLDGSNLADLSFGFGLDVGDFTLQGSPCSETTDYSIAGDPDHGYYIATAMDPYTCTDDPASPARDHGNLQVFLDGYYFGTFNADPGNLDLSPKITMVYWEPVAFDWDGDAGTAETTELVGICNFYFPDASPNYHTNIVNKAADELGAAGYAYGHLPALRSEVAANASLIPAGELDYLVWYWNLQQGWYFDYLGDTVPAFQGESRGDGHSVVAQLAYDTHEVVYGSIGDRVVFTDFPLDELTSWSAANGLPWCGDVLGVANPNLL